MAKLIATEPALAYEDLMAARISGSMASVFEAICPGLSTRLAVELSNVRDKPTSTLLGSHSNWRLQWTDQVQKIFVALGLDEANKLLGYA
jgi:hypothetical protein